MNNQRTIIYNEIFQDNYYSDMNDNISNWNNLMDKYNELINKIDNNSKYLKENCNNLEYYHLEITPKCDSFVNNYEMMINYYISDVTVYNNNIDSYNLWITENFIESSNIIDKFDKNVYTEYIDFDNDGVFLGKE